MSESVNLVCGHCAAIVRVPIARLAQSPKCPTCHAVLIDGKPVTLTAQSFDRHLSRTQLPVLVDFWAPWCGPCQVMAPYFEQAARQLGTQVRFAKLDTEAEPVPASRFNIRSIPTVILFRQGAEVARQSGAMDTSQITRWLAAQMGGSLRTA